MKKLNSLTNKIATVALAGAIALSSAGVIAATAAVTDPHPAHAANAGWQKSGNRWWYQYSNKSYATGWEKVGNTWYYFYNDGWMAANGWQKVGGNWFWLESSGAMRESSWLQVNGTWYYLKAGGYMATGWQKVGGNWFWLESSGAMRESSWLQVNGTWYYLKAGGYMATGWQKVGGKWYYLDGSGAMATSRWVGNYYVDKNGVMATNTWVGSYYVDDSGAWVSNAKPTTSTNNGSSTNATKTKVWVVDEPACDVPLTVHYQYRLCNETGCSSIFGVTPQMVEKILAYKTYSPEEITKGYEVGNQTIRSLGSGFAYVAHDGKTYYGSEGLSKQIDDHVTDNRHIDENGVLGLPGNHGGWHTESLKTQIGKIHYPEEGHWEYR